MFNICLVFTSWFLLICGNIYLCKLNQVQLLAKDDVAVCTTNNNNFSDDGAKTINQELRKLLTNIFVDNTNIRKQVNSVMRYALKINTSSDTNVEE